MSPQSDYLPSTIFPRGSLVNPLATTLATSAPQVDPTVKLQKKVMDALWTPQGMAVIGMCSLIALGSMRQNPNKNRKNVATGGAGTPDLLTKARLQGIKDLESDKLGDTLLWLGDPESEDSMWFRKICPGLLTEGGPGSGKSFTVQEQALLSAIRQGFRIVLWDFKYPHQTSRVAAYAAKMGYKIHVLAPSFPESGRLNLVELLKDDKMMAKAKELFEAAVPGTTTLDDLIRGQVITKAEELTNVIKENSNRQKGGGDDGNSFFSDAAVPIISGFMSLIVDWEFNDLLMVQALLSTPDLPARLLHAKEWMAPSIYLQFNQILSAADAPKQLAGTISTCQQIIDKILGILFLPALCGQSNIPLDLDDKTMIVIGLNKDYRKTLGPVLSAIAHSIISRNMGSHHKTPLVFATDELPTIYLPDLSNWLAEGRSDGFCGLMAFQTRSQMVSIYGEDKTRTIYNSTPSKAFFNPNDIERAEQIAKWTGDVAIDYSTGGKSFTKGTRTRSTGEQVRVRLDIEAAKINRMPQGTALFISPGFENPALQEQFIPIRKAVTIPEGVQATLNESTRLWDSHIKPGLLKRNETRLFGDADIQLRRDLIEKILPMPPEEDANDGDPLNQFFGQLNEAAGQKAKEMEAERLAQSDAELVSVTMQNPGHYEANSGGLIDPNLVDDLDRNVTQDSTQNQGRYQEPTEPTKQASNNARKSETLRKLKIAMKNMKLEGNTPEN